jgi:hypothetical protein
MARRSLLSDALRERIERELTEGLGRRLRRAGAACPTTRGGDEEPQGRLDRPPDVLAEAIEASLPPREERDLDAPLFAGVTEAGSAWRSSDGAGSPRLVLVREPD